MQRSYLKTRSRNRNVYYGAKELAGQTVKDCRYEKLNQVSITFIFENNTTPNVPAIAKIQFTDVNTKEIYTDLITLYEVNLNIINQKSELAEELVTLKNFLSIKNHEELCAFVKTHETEFAKRLVTEYMNAISDDKTLLEVEGAEKFMFKLSEEVLLEEREEGREEGLLTSPKIIKLFLSGNNPEAISKSLMIPVESVRKVIDSFNNE
jgi:hypothetical protein